MTVLARLGASSCFVLAAFAWVPAFIDRAGVAALGFAFLSLAVGRARVGAGAPLPLSAGVMTRGDLEQAQREAESIVGRIQQYAAPGDRAPR